jgi:circadian clock protein KaiC
MDRSSFVATGVPQLDLLLGGGIVENSLLLIAGLTGSGKTVLAAQIASTAAERGDTVLLVTAFSEPHNKLLTNLRTFRFWNPDHVGDRIKLVNVQHQLAASVSEAADTIVREVRDHQTRMVVLDGFQGIRISSESALLSSQFLYDLNSKLNLLGVTAIVTFDVGLGSDIPAGELSAVDGLISLEQELHGDQAIRMMQMIKQRGAAPLLGRHSFAITEDGLRFYPRQEVVSVADDVALGDKRITFGIEPLDEMLRGGLTEGTVTMIAGAEGVGKTLLGLHYLAQAVAVGEPGLMITFHETPQQLLAKARAFGFDLQAAIDSGSLLIQHFAPAELNADMVAQWLRSRAASGQLQRLVIDGLNEIERRLIERGRAAGFFAALLTFLRSQRITTCITQEIDPLIGRELSYAGKNLSALADNIVLMQRDETLDSATHSLAVLKMRFSAHDRIPRPYLIGDGDLQFAAAPTNSPGADEAA